MRRLLLALVAMTAIVVALVAYTLDPGPLQRLELRTVDARFDVRCERPVDPRIVLVALDRRTAARLRGYPSLRPVFARALLRLAAAAPRAIASDELFIGRRDAADRPLIKAIHSRAVAPRLVLGTDRFDETGHTQLLGRDDQNFTGPPRTPTARGSRPGPWAGYVGVPRDPNGAARRIERAVALRPGAMRIDTLAVATARVAGTRGASELPNIAWIDFHGSVGSFPRVSLSDVLQGRPHALAAVRRKIVLLGTDGELNGDIHPTSAPGPGVMDGFEIQAHAIATALDRFPLRDGGGIVDAMLIVALGLLPLAFALTLRQPLVVPLAAVAGALFCVGAQLAFQSGVVVSVVFPLLSLVLATVGVASVQIVRRDEAPRSTAGARRSSSAMRSRR